MGKHFLPRFYLKGFTEEPGSLYLWVYEKGGKKPYRTNIKNVAQETKMYSDDTEAYLAQMVESPAAEVIQKICNLKTISVDEKRVLAGFISVLFKRTPKGRKRAEKWFEEFAPEYFARLEQELENMKERLPDKREIIEKRLREVKELRLSGRIRAAEIWETALPAEKTPGITDALRNMTWVFWVSKKRMAFLTSDSAIFFFESMGVSHLHAEVTFPVSSRITLWATWRKDLKDRTYSLAKPQIIRELNRRTVSTAERFVYSPLPEEWILKLTSKKRLRLLRIV